MDPKTHMAEACLRRGDYEDCCGAAGEGVPGTLAQRPVVIASFALP